MASALVVVPDGGAEHPVVAWAHGTTGFGTGCAPSLLDEPFVAGAMPDFDEALAAGWAIVATDYTGLGTDGSEPYLIGQGEARSVLDSVRAAQQLAAADLADETVVWGHSQGGHAALWTGGLAPEYAPELDLVGVAAMAPASNLPALLSGLSDSAAGGVFGSFALAAYAAQYPDVRANDYVRPGARIMMQSMQQRCLTDPGTIVSIMTSVFSDQPVWSKSPGEGALGARALQNVPVLPIEAPLLVARAAPIPWCCRRRRPTGSPSAVLKGNGSTTARTRAATTWGSSRATRPCSASSSIGPQSASRVNRRRTPARRRRKHPLGGCRHRCERPVSASTTTSIRKAASWSRSTRT
ncbi:hypothetical protein ASE14_08570 [Agromyces sp. Root81]|uniref:lipase family protein n=1 Tax=Agromyces sp. Root81 TaxID=1736601 RepID=UPI0006FEE080|nr:lipase family protein [Agromyces sp. Root81]KRC60994.1 hypothetical protein ASE14_08570 [Agromyces sp. Root81]